MSTAGGPKIVNDGLVLSLDGGAERSTFRVKQTSNILPDSNNWTTGTGGQTGYAVNGSSSEQNRKEITDDPWGRTSIVWATTPDATSGADGGWNTSFYSIDRTYTYRMSIWVRRYTAGTGGTFYFGLHFSPTNTPQEVNGGSLQSNPYFTYPAQSSLTQDQWYLVVYHVHPYGYTGGDHPETGWYENGVKISSKSAGNTNGDVQFLSDTTSLRHRTYHYYTTNTASGLEFCAPRIDKLDGTEPSIKQLINRGESGWRDLASGTDYTVPNGLVYTNYNKQGSFNFDGTDDYLDLSNDIGYSDEVSVFAIFKSNGTPAGGYHIICGGLELEISIPTAGQLRTGVYTNARYVNNLGSGLTDGNYHYIGFTFSDNTKTSYIDGVSVGTQSTAGTLTNSFSNRRLGRFGSDSSYYLNGEIPLYKVFNRALTPQEVQQNYNAYKNRFNLD